MAGAGAMTVQAQPASLERHEFRCESCGYGAVARIAPEFCPMCRGSVWMLAGVRTTRPRMGGSTHFLRAAAARD